MVMLCWFYCIPFAKFLYYVAGLLLFIFSLFVLKRGIMMARQGLRRFAYILMVISALKVFLLDMHFSAKDLLCDVSLLLKSATCNAATIQTVEILGIVLLLLSLPAIYMLSNRHKFVQEDTTTTIEKVHLRFWANASMWSVTIMVIWQMAPWVGYLTVGSTPAFFEMLSWHSLAIINIALLVVGFWKVESCSWKRSFNSSASKKRYINSVWTPKDTLWMSLSIFIITLIMSYAAHDALNSFNS